jgi:hypothetical protein
MMKALYFDLSGFCIWASKLRFAQMLHLEQQKLAELAHVHRNTVSRMPASPRLHDFLRDAVRVLAAAFTLAGSADRALYWFRSSSHPGFRLQDS